MATKKQNTTGMLLRVEKLNCSVYGNPRYSVVFHDHTTGKVLFGKTKSDAMYTYNMPSPDMECNIVWHKTKKGNVVIDDIAIISKGVDD